jgi:hypothetical protein
MKMRCRRVNPDLVRTGNHFEEVPVRDIQYQTVEVDKNGACLDAESGSKGISTENIPTVDSDICEALIARGDCPMIIWGLLNR